MANPLADNLTSTALKQLQTSWNFKRPRIAKIQNFRRLYNVEVLPKLRVQFNTPLPIFSGMIDTLQADLNDTLLIEYSDDDPADWKAAQKANAAITKESTSARPGAKWGKKFRSYRFEKIMTGRGILKFTAGNEGGYYSNLDVVPFEDFYFEPTGGPDLDNHLFKGQQNVWKTKWELQEGAKSGLYDKHQVKRLTEHGVGNDFKHAALWDSYMDIGNRFAPLGLDVESNNYVGDEVFNMCEWVLSYQGRDWYILFEPFTGIWVRFEKLTDVNSAGQGPWMSSASHEDLKNFASKGFADDLYPIADSIITLFNQDLTNRQKRNFNPRAYDKDMFKNVKKLDEAMHRPDALVPADTKNGARRISEGVYTFETPALTGTIDLISWLKEDTGTNLGVTEMQQGAAQDTSKKVGVANIEFAHINKRLEFNSEPFREVGQQLGERFFVSLKDYMTEPMSIKLLGEHGVEWDLLKRVDLNVKKNFEINVSSQMSRNSLNDASVGRKIKAFEMTKGSPNLNAKFLDETILREVGKLSEHDIALAMDTTNDTNKETIAEVASAIQEIVLRGKMPKTNYNADLFFLKRLNDFAKNHQDTLPTKTLELIIAYMNAHQEIAISNAEDRAKEKVQEEMKAGMVPTELPMEEQTTV